MLNLIIILQIIFNILLYILAIITNFDLIDSMLKMLNESVSSFAKNDNKNFTFFAIPKFVRFYIEVKQNHVSRGVRRMKIT